MPELATRFPKGLHYGIFYDTTPFIRESVNEVFHTLLESVVLVAAVILLFLQDWKALLLPVIDMAVSLVGTFAVMKLLGFSFNNLSLFGLVLAIGIVVDDSIVVLENIERWLEKGLSVREATIRAMDEITGPVLAITLVLSSVLLPSAFLGGLTGQFFRQFAMTISVSMLISAINAMTMTPARAAWIFGSRSRKDEGGRMKDEKDKDASLIHPSSFVPHPSKEALPWWSRTARRPGDRVAVGAGAGPAAGLARRIVCDRGAARSLKASLLTWGANLALFLPGAIAGGVLGRFVISAGELGPWQFWRIQLVLRSSDASLRQDGGWFLRLSAVVLVVYVGLIGLTIVGFARVPSGFLPNQDKGYLLVILELPDSASLERTAEATDSVENRDGNARGCPRWAFRGYRPTERQQLELRFRVRHPQAV